MVLRTPADFTRAELIVPDLSSRTAGDVLDELWSVLQRNVRVTELSILREMVSRREEASCTVVPPDWALPHVRIPGEGHLWFALGRSPRGLNWFGPAGASVRMVFLLIVPESEAMTYLLLISALARLSRDPARAEKLLTAPGAVDILETLSAVHLRTPNKDAVRS